MSAARHLEPGQPGHLHVQEYQIGAEILDQAERLDAVGRLADDGGLTLAFQQIAQLFARQLLVVDDEGPERHADTGTRSGATSSGISSRARVPCAGTLCSCSW